MTTKTDRVRSNLLRLANGPHFYLTKSGHPHGKRIRRFRYWLREAKRLGMVGQFSQAVAST